MKLPFTYAVNLLTESAGGIYLPSAWSAILILLFVWVAFLVVVTWLFLHLEQTSEKISEVTQKSHIFH